MLSFKPSQYNYEVVVMVRKVALALVGSLFACGRREWQLIGGTCVLFCSLLVHVWCRPFVLPLQDQLELMSLTTITVTLLMIASSEAAVRIRNAVVVLNAVVMVVFAVALVREMCKSHAVRKLMSLRTRTSVPSYPVTYKTDSDAEEEDVVDGDGEDSVSSCQSDKSVSVAVDDVEQMKVLLGESDRRSCRMHLTEL